MSCDSGIYCFPIHLGVNIGPHTHRHTGENLQGRVNTRSAGLSVSGQGIGTSYVHRHADSVNHFGAGKRRARLRLDRNVPVLLV